jgi:hypothetical protein
MLIAVSSFGESLRRVFLTAPAETVLSQGPNYLRFDQVY